MDTTGCFSKEDYTYEMRKEKAREDWEKREKELKEAGKPGQLRHPDDM